MKKKIPVYLFTGLLESGKTTFIKKKLQDENFNSGENTLIIVCETGIEEYNIKNDNIKIIYIDDQKKINKETFNSIIDKFERVLIEYNGMWKLDELYDSLPSNWLIFQQIMFVDALTFKSYNALFKKQLIDMYKECEMCIFNRLNYDTDKEILHRNVRIYSMKPEIYFEYKDNHIEKDNIKEEFPFDINSNFIQIDSKDYAIWYVDIINDINKYMNKKIQIEGQIKRENNQILFGRKVMICCEADIKFLAVILEYENSNIFETGKWYKIKGKINKTEMSFILSVIEFKQINEPNINEEVASF